MRERRLFLLRLWLMVIMVIGLTIVLVNSGLFLKRLPVEPARATDLVSPPQGIAPVFYIMGDYASKNYQPGEKAGAIGGWFYVGWDQINPAPNTFSWGRIDGYLAKESAKKTKLFSGAEISKPIALSVQILSNVDELAVPDWVLNSAGRPKVDPDGNGPCPSVVRPPWESPYFQEKFRKMVEVLGDKYDQDPRINSIWIASGLYGENVVSGYHPHANCQSQYDFSPNFSSFVLTLPDLYRQAFPHKPIFMIATAPTGRLELVQKALNLNPILGIKHNSLDYDLPDQTFYAGQWTVLNYYWGEVERRNLAGMVGYEHAFANGQSQMYWALLAGLSRKMTLIDLPSAYLDTLSEMQSQGEAAISRQDNSGDYFALWEFVENHLGRNVWTTPSVWIVLRDTQFPDRGGEPGDWEFYLYRPEPIEGQHLRSEVGQDRTVVVPGNELPGLAKAQIIGRQGTAYCRRTDQASNNYYMYFKIDERWPALNTTGFDIEVTYLDKGNDLFALKYGNGPGKEMVVQKTNTNKFLRKRFILDNHSLKEKINSAGDNFRLDCRQDGDEYIHMVRVIPKNWQAPAWDFGQVSPSPASSTPTPTLTITPTLVLTTTPTLPPGQATPTPIRAPTATPILVPLSEFKAGWNYLTWQNDWPIDFDLGSLPLSCPYVSYLKDNWFNTFVREYSPSECFIRGQDYSVFCLEDVYWGMR